MSAKVCVLQERIRDPDRWRASQNPDELRVQRTASPLTRRPANQPQGSQPANEHYKDQLKSADSAARRNQTARTKNL